MSRKRSKDQIFAKSRPGETSEPALPIFHAIKIVHTTEGTMVAHAWEGSSMLSRCGPRFPLHLQKGRRRKHTDILWVHHLFVTFWVGFKIGWGRVAQETPFRSRECRTSWRKYWSSQQIPSPHLTAPEGHFPQRQPATIRFASLGKRGNQEHCLEIGELRGVCAKKHQYGQQSSLHLLSSCLYALAPSFFLDPQRKATVTHSFSRFSLLLFSRAGLSFKLLNLSTENWCL